MIVKTASRSKCYIEFHSYCLEGEVPWGCSAGQGGSVPGMELELSPWLFPGRGTAQWGEHLAELRRPRLPQDVLVSKAAARGMHSGEGSASSRLLVPIPPARHDVITPRGQKHALPPCPSHFVQLNPILPDLEYLGDQHLLLSIKGTESCESYGAHGMGTWAGCCWVWGSLYFMRRRVLHRDAVDDRQHGPAV